MGKLEIDSLTKEFGDDKGKIVAVDKLNIDTNDGDFLVMVGPSGCGKSTTLRCIAGLETVTNGDIKLDGTSIKNKRPIERNIAMVFQNYALYPHMSAYENMAFGLKMTTEMSSDEIEQKVTETAELMGIEELLEKKPGELSGGQQQRVALGRAIVREPEVFLLDEPLSNLDAKLRTQMRTELQNLQQNLNVTTVYVTHDQTEAMTMADKIAVLNDGELQQLGTPLECYHEPKNQFVAGFIGSPSMNFLNVNRTGNILRHDRFEFSITDEMKNQLEVASEELILGIRPEDIEISKSPVKNSVETEVEVVEPMGDVTIIYVSIGDKTITVSNDSEFVFEPGQTIHIHFPENLIHVFDKTTGEAVKNRERRNDAEVPEL
ncbi:ABC transporter ATP-binding protein [Haladaptatus sp. NG-SE-30]